MFSIHNIIYYARVMQKWSNPVLIHSFIHSALLCSASTWKCSNKTNNSGICYLSWGSRLRFQVLVIWWLNCSNFLCKISHWSNPRALIFIFILMQVQSLRLTEPSFCCVKDKYKWTNYKNCVSTFYKIHIVLVKNTLG